MKGQEANGLKRYVRSETLDDKTFLFRGQSNNSYQKNYSKKYPTRFNSRFYAYELYDGIQLFGNIAVYELLPSANIFDYGDSVEEFIDEYQLDTYEVAELYKIYRIHSLSESSEYGGDVSLDYHDLYHSRQLTAIAYLEDNLSSKYDGIGWYEAYDTPEEQVMIWNNDVLRRLNYSEAKQVLAQIENRHNELGITDSLYIKDPESGDYNYRLARR